MYKLVDGAKIYIACYSKHATGGTELLHQLCYKLNQNGFEAFMYYFDYDEKKISGSPIPKKFEEYKVLYKKKIEDNKFNLLILPETALYLINRYKNINKVIWWLSVDFYLSAQSYNKKGYYIRQAIKCLINMNIKGAYSHINKKWFNPFDRKNDELIYNFTQSYYAKQFLISNGVSPDKIYILSDYINKNLINFTSNTLRSNRILYNPLKGIISTNKIISKCKGYEFVPLKGLEKQEMIKLMQTSKIYIDFGNHPGKDRIPREAAMNGLIIITNRNGSANFFEDVPIPSEYKINELNGFEENVKRMIDDIFNNYDSHINNFISYRNIIQNEENYFDSQLAEIFKKNE